jgi:hypothetical protein
VVSVLFLVSTRVLRKRQEGTPRKSSRQRGQGRRSNSLAQLSTHNARRVRLIRTAEKGGGETNLEPVLRKIISEQLGIDKLRTKHVREEEDDFVFGIVDGGCCDVGVYAAYEFLFT